MIQMLLQRAVAVNTISNLSRNKFKEVKTSEKLVRIMERRHAGAHKKDFLVLPPKERTARLSRPPYVGPRPPVSVVTLSPEKRIKGKSETSTIVYVFHNFKCIIFIYIYLNWLFYTPFLLLALHLTLISS